MIDTKEGINTHNMQDTVIEAILKKQGEAVINIDFNDVENSVCDRFIICHADSGIQVEAIANSVIDEVKENLDVNVWRKSGFENSQWILLDYGDTVVHVFQTPYREFYNLEDLWADAKITTFEENSKQYN